MGRSLFLGQAVEVAEDQRIAEGFRKLIELVMEGSPIVVILDSLLFAINDMACGSHFSSSLLVGAPANRGGACLRGHPQRNTVQPA